jgi:hypothetical protein
MWSLTLLLFVCSLLFSIQGMLGKIDGSIQAILFIGTVEKNAFNKRLGSIFSFFF